MIKKGSVLELLAFSKEELDSRKVCHPEAADGKDSAKEDPTGGSQGDPVLSLLIPIFSQGLRSLTLFVSVERANSGRKSRTETGGTGEGAHQLTSSKDKD